MSGMFYASSLLIIVGQCFGGEARFEGDTIFRSFSPKGKTPNLEDIFFNVIEMTKQQNERIVALETRVHDLTMTVDSVQAKYEGQLRINTMLESKVGTIQCDVATPSENVEIRPTRKPNTAVDENAMKNSLGKQTSDSDGSEIDTLNENKEIHEKKNLRTKLIRNKKQFEEGQVAFSAYLDHSLLHVTIGDTIIFNKILFNSGQGYNALTGVFTAPATGVYFFTFTIHSQRTETNMQMVLEDNNVVGVVTHADSTGRENNMATNSAVIHVSVGQSVWIKAVFDQDAELISTPDFRQVTFSGFLLA